MFTIQRNIRSSIRFKRCLFATWALSNICVRSHVMHLHAIIVIANVRIIDRENCYSIFFLNENTRVPFIYFLVYPFSHVSRAADLPGRDRISVIRRAITLSALLAATAPRWPEGYRANESERCALQLARSVIAKRACAVRETWTFE